jgi:hypothetical protein
LGRGKLDNLGDGIRASLQQIATLLEDRWTLGFSLGLIEMAVYAADASSGPFYVQPRLLLQTKIVTRTVFVAGRDGDGAQVAKVSAASKPQTLSEQDFYAALAKANPTYPEGLRGFLESVQAVGVQRELLSTCVLRVELPESNKVGPNLGRIDGAGTVVIWLWAAYGRDKKLEPIAREDMERVVAFLGPEAFIKQTKPHDGYISYQNRASIPLSVCSVIKTHGSPRYRKPSGAFTLQNTTPEGTISRKRDTKCTPSQNNQTDREDAIPGATMTKRRSPYGEAHWTDEQLSSPSADPELNQKTWDELAGDAKPGTTREDWKRFGPGGYERWRRFTWQDGDIELHKSDKPDRTCGHKSRRGH